MIVAGALAVANSASTSGGTLIDARLRMRPMNRGAGKMPAPQFRCLMGVERQRLGQTAVCDAVENLRRELQLLNLNEFVGRMGLVDRARAEHHRRHAGS